MLVGRDGEVGLIGAALGRARDGSATVLRLSGDPGIGKTALLDRAAELAGTLGMRVARFTAIQTDAEIPAVGLDLLLARLGRDPDTAGSPAALLEAIARASADRPLLLLVDDVQWLDESSLRALSFACRRLLADPVAAILACRTSAATHPLLEPFARVDVPPLSTADSIELLRHMAPEMPDHVALEVARDLAGVPLALTGVRELLSADAVAGRAPLPSPVPVGQAVQLRYAEGFEALDARSRRALTLLAVDDTADPTVLLAALDQAGLTAADLRPAEARGLVRMDPVPRFVHPLARAAVHAAVPAPWTREAHSALAVALGARGDPRALRHRTLSTFGADEQLAGELEEAAHESAFHAPSEAGVLALLAADRSPRPADRQRRLLLAAELSSDPDRAVELALQVRAATRDPTVRARATLVIADNGHATDPAGLIRLLDGIDRRQVGRALSIEVLCRLTWGAMEGADLALLDRITTTMQATADASWLLLAALGSALMFLGRNAPGVAALRRAHALSQDVDPSSLSPDTLTSWAVIPSWLGEDDGASRTRFREMDHALRARGRPMDVVAADFFGAERVRRDGGWDRAIALLSHGISILHALGYPAGVDEARLAGLLAFRGEEDGTRQHLESAQRAFAERPSPWLELWVAQTRGALDVTMGRPKEAVRVLSPLREVPFVGRGCRDAPFCARLDLVEAHVALGERAEAERVTEELAALSDGLVDPFGPAMVARSRALVAPGDADALFTAALELLAGTSEVFETARTELHLGEHLRRTRRRRASRPHLLAAHEAFTWIGARPWADRAQRELLASGEHGVRPAEDEGGSESDLTPQELRVALEVAHGLSNASVASALFLSPKTVEFHLGKVYRKLGVRSRGGLAHALSARGLLDGGRQGVAQR